MLLYQQRLPQLICLPSPPGCLCLGAFLGALGGKIVALRVPNGFPGAGESILGQVCRVAVRLLDPKLEDSAALEVGICAKSPF